MEKEDVYFDAIGYLPGNHKVILYRKRYKDCEDACSQVNKLSNSNSKLFYVVRPVIVEKNLSLF